MFNGETATPWFNQEALSTQICWLDRSLWPETVHVELPGIYRTTSFICNTILYANISLSISMYNSQSLKHTLICTTATAKKGLPSFGVNFQHKHRFWRYLNEKCSSEHKQQLFFKYFSNQGIIHELSSKVSKLQTIIFGYGSGAIRARNTSWQKKTSGTYTPVFGYGHAENLLQCPSKKYSIVAIFFTRSHCVTMCVYAHFVTVPIFLPGGPMVQPALESTNMLTQLPQSFAPFLPSIQT